MNLLSLFRRRTSAPVARDRLQVLLAHERARLVERVNAIALAEQQRGHEAPPSPAPHVHGRTLAPPCGEDNLSPARAPRPG